MLTARDNNPGMSLFLCLLVFLPDLLPPLALLRRLRRLRRLSPLGITTGAMVCCRQPEGGPSPVDVGVVAVSVSLLLVAILPYHANQISVWP